MIEDEKKSINSRFDMVMQETRNFHELLSKFSTEKKKCTSQTARHADINQSTLHFDGGWEYSGSIVEGKFDGYGCLTHNQKEIYKGFFKGGKMDKNGKLFYNDSFRNLIEEIEEWRYYEGEFEEGRVSGFGSLCLGSEQIIIGKWDNGRIVYSIVRKMEEQP